MIMKILENSKLNSWNSKQLWKFQRTQNLAFGILNNYEKSKKLKT